jgi:hypothetical protein
MVQKFKDMEVEVKKQVEEKGNFKEVVAKSRPRTRDEVFKDLRDDAELKPYLVPVPDYGMATIILLKRIEKKLDDRSKP